MKAGDFTSEEETELRAVELTVRQVRKLEELSRMSGCTSHSRNIGKIIEEEFDRKGLWLPPPGPPMLRCVETESTKTFWNPPLRLERGVTALVQMADGGRIEIVYKTRAEIESCWARPPMPIEAQGGAGIVSE